VVRRPSYHGRVAGLLIRWVSNIAALYVAAWLLDGVTYRDDLWTLVLAGGVFTAVNAVVKPILTILSIPFIILTLGLFLLVVNVAMLYLTDALVSDFDITTFGTALLAAIVVTVVNWVLGALLPGR
jgi:putative membrane protein